jgi:hypothetical protein
MELQPPNVTALRELYAQSELQWGPVWSRIFVPQPTGRLARRQIHTLEISAPHSFHLTFIFL